VGFLRDGELLGVRVPSHHRHVHCHREESLCKWIYRYHDDDEAHDDELQRFSKSAVALVSQVRMVLLLGSIGSARATKPVAVAVPLSL